MVLGTQIQEASQFMFMFWQWLLLYTLQLFWSVVAHFGYIMPQLLHLLLEKLAILEL
jgi:hypothetical protein